MATPDAAARRPVTDGELYLRLLRESRPLSAQLFLVLLLSLSSAPLALLLPIPLQVVIDSVIGHAPPPWFLGVFWRVGEPGTADGVLIACVLLLMTVTLLQQLEGFASWWLQLYTGERLVLDLRARLFEHLQRMSVLYHDRVGTADAVYRIQYDASAVQYVIVGGLIPLVTSALTVVAMLCVIWTIHVPLALVSAVVVPLLFILTEWYRRQIRGRWDQIKVRESHAMGVVQEVLSSLRVVKAFGQEVRERTRFTTASSEVLRAQLKVIGAESAFGLAVALTLAAGTAAVLVLGVQAQRSGAITLGQLLLVMAYLGQLYRPLDNVSRKVATLQGALAGARRAFAVLDEEPDVAERPNPRSLQRARGVVRFERVTFAYPDGPTVLRDVTFDVPAGARIGVIGRTGSGKTTLVHLLARFHDPSSGRICLDDVDLRDYRLRDLRHQFSIVLQEPVLFSTTLAENIAYGRPEASRAEIVLAAVAANAHEFIAQMPGGYETIVGERGMTLSGGERQRVALARAFLKDAPILILDEPTSSIDLASEAAVMDATRRLMEGRTTFLIAHRLQTVEHCDRILKVDFGRVVSLPNLAAVTQAVSGSPGAGS